MKDINTSLMTQITNLRNLYLPITIVNIYAV